jgi:hypothetical protein
MTAAPIEGPSPDPIEAAIAQLVEHLIRNEGVGSSSLSCGTNDFKHLASITPQPLPSFTIQ